MPGTDLRPQPSTALPILDLSKENDAHGKRELLDQLHDALFNVGFLYIKNHGVHADIIDNLVKLLPKLFDQPAEEKSALSKSNSPHFLGYSGFAEEITLGTQDLREQFDFATELPVIWDPTANSHQEHGTTGTHRDFSKLYWRLRGPNQWPSESNVPGFRKAYTDYHNSLQDLSYRFVHLVEEAFGIPVGTFDTFFLQASSGEEVGHKSVPPQHRIKLVKYPSGSLSGGSERGQGVGAHKDSSGWLTFLYQVGEEEGLEVLGTNGEWIAAPPIRGTFVVNFGNAFEAATEGAVKATVHRVLVCQNPASSVRPLIWFGTDVRKAPTPLSNPRYSIPFFQGLPLDLTVSEIRSYIPESVRALRQNSNHQTLNGNVSAFLDPRWDNLGESQLRKWIRSHEDVARKWYGDETTNYYFR